ncbi:MAG TPA: ABC transporter ATP-binding protein [Saprospiraceae bacterium]|nr:ABC transporter ATP-binding protein [Saprospiraceae bacterium]
MIQSSNIHKTYGNLNVLNGVNLTVKKGEMVSIVGKSGAGKSTFLHILGTLDLPDAGELIISGHRTTKMNPKELAKFRNKHIGFVFQFHHLLPEFTALENVCIPGWIKKTPEAQVTKRAKEILDFLELSDRLDHKPTQLSGGEQQRVAIARAVINNPSIILADEPTGNLDTTTSKELHRFLLKLKKEFNQTMVIVTHSHELAAICDRKIEMIDGHF